MNSGPGALQSPSLASMSRKFRWRIGITTPPVPTTAERAVASATVTFTTAVAASDWSHSYTTIHHDDTSTALLAAAIHSTVNCPGMNVDGSNATTFAGLGMPGLATSEGVATSSLIQLIELTAVTKNWAGWPHVSGSSTRMHAVSLALLNTGKARTDFDALVT